MSDLGPDPFCFHCARRYHQTGDYEGNRVALQQSEDPTLRLRWSTRWWVLLVASMVGLMKFINVESVTGLHEIDEFVHSQLLFAVCILLSYVRQSRN